MEWDMWHEVGHVAWNRTCGMKWDMWHRAKKKNFGKKLCTVATERGKSVLKPWLGEIKNYFYYSAEKGDEMLTKTKMLSIMNNCCYVHKWALGQCDYDSTTEDEDHGDKAWLDPLGPESLENVITEK